MSIIYTHELSQVNWAKFREALIEDGFHNGRSPAQYRASFENSAVTCLAYDGDALIGTARALSDGVCNAYIVDVWTQSDYRRLGIASEMMRRLLAKLPGQHVYLFSDPDVAPLYAQLGFEPQGVGLGRVVGAWLDSHSVDAE